MCVCTSVCKHLIIPTLSHSIKKLLVLNHYYILLNVSSFSIRKHLNYLQSKKKHSILCLMFQHIKHFHIPQCNIKYAIHSPRAKCLFSPLVFDTVINNLNVS